MPGRVVYRHLAPLEEPTWLRPRPRYVLSVSVANVFPPFSTAETEKTEIAQRKTQIRTSLIFGLTPVMKWLLRSQPAQGNCRAAYPGRRVPLQ